jgi:ABC-2 type transport system permease protein
MAYECYESQISIIRMQTRFISIALMRSFFALFKANVKIFYRNTQGFYWTILMPAIIYTALSVLPLNSVIHSGLSYSNYVLPGIITLSIMQTGVYGLAYWMVDLKSLGVIKRLMAAPLKPGAIVSAIVASRLIVILVEVGCLTLIGLVFFHATFAGNVFSTLVIAMLGGAIFLLAGLLIANYAKSYDAAAPLTSAVALPLTFLGNVFYPIDALPRGLQILARALPITYLADGLRQAYLYPFDFQKIGFDVFILGVWLMIMLAATLSVFRLKE